MTSVGKSRKGELSNPVCISCGVHECSQVTSGGLRGAIGVLFVVFVRGMMGLLLRADIVYLEKNMKLLITVI